MATYLLCCYLLHLLFGAVLTGTEKFAYSGMSFKLFTNLTFQKHMTLYRNGNEESVISAVWEVKNGTVTTNFLNPAYTGKIFMEIDKTPFIMICNADQTLSAKYLVIYDKDTPGPKVDLKIIGNLTEDEFHKLLDDDLGFMKKYFGNLTEGQIVKIRKLHDDNTEHIKEYLGNLTEEQIEKIRKMQDDNTEDIKEYLEKVMQEKMLPSNHPKEVLKESSDRWYLLFLGLLICIIGILIGIIIYLCIRLPANKLSEDQVHTWLNDHPGFMDIYLGKLTEDQICLQIRKWFDAYPGLLKNKALDAFENDQVITPTLDELSVRLTQHSETGIEGNPSQPVYTQEICNASQHSDEDQAVRSTSFEPLQVQMKPTQKTLDASQSSDELVKKDSATDLTLSDLAVTLHWPVTGTEDNHGQLELSSTCNSPNAATFSVPGPSGIQPFNKDKQDANPEHNIAQDVRVDIEDSDSEDKCKEPLLEGEKGCK